MTDYHPQWAGLHHSVLGLHHRSNSITVAGLSDACILSSFKDTDRDERVQNGSEEKRLCLEWIEREDKQKDVIHALSPPKAQPSCFVEQKLIGARQDSEEQESPIDWAINIQTSRSGQRRNIKTAGRRTSGEFCNAFHSTERSPEGAVMTRVIGFFSSYDNLHQSCHANKLWGHWEGHSDSWTSVLSDNDIDEFGSAERFPHAGEYFSCFLRVFEYKDSTF